MSVFPTKVEFLHWPFEDPALVEGTEEVRKAAFRKVRDRIRGRIQTYLTTRAVSTFSRHSLKMTIEPEPVGVSLTHVRGSASCCNLLAEAANVSER